MVGLKGRKGGTRGGAGRGGGVPAHGGHRSLGQRGRHGKDGTHLGLRLRVLPCDFYPRGGCRLRGEGSRANARERGGPPGPDALMYCKKQYGREPAPPPNGGQSTRPAAGGQRLEDGLRVLSEVGIDL